MDSPHLGRNAGRFCQPLRLFRRKRSQRMPRRGHKDRTSRRPPFQDIKELRAGEGLIAIWENNTAVAIHEIAHRLQTVIPGLDEFFQRYHRQRTPGRPYPRKRFGLMRRGRAIELMPYSFMWTFGGDPDLLRRLLRKEPDLLHLVLGLLDGYRATDL